ncbi:TonB-dependent receptor, partial [Rhodovulum sulfidophilum]|nr:TonB-dependent receptor [Rhodovulum sulfidophilum]
SVPAETLVDLGLSYDFAQVSPKFSGALLNVNIGNLFDKDYVSSCTSQLYCFAGERRTVSASLSYRW